MLNYFRTSSRFNLWSFRLQGETDATNIKEFAHLSGPGSKAPLFWIRARFSEYRGLQESYGAPRVSGWQFHWAQKTAVPGAGRAAPASSSTSTQSSESGGVNIIVPLLANVPRSLVAPVRGLNHQP